VLDIISAHVVGLGARIGQLLAQLRVVDQIGDCIQAVRPIGIISTGNGAATSIHPARIVAASGSATAQLLRESSGTTLAAARTLAAVGLGLAITRLAALSPTLSTGLTASTAVALASTLALVIRAIGGLIGVERLVNRIDILS